MAEQNNNNYGRDQYIINSAEKPKRSKYEQWLLNELKGQVFGRLKRSIPGDAFISLNMQTQPDQVSYPHQSKIPINSRFSEALPPETKISNVFEVEERLILILGEPGSGKTTILLKLAQYLLDVSEVNIDNPIPVLFELSSWKENLKIEDLMVEQLERIYSVPQKEANLLVKERRILPLLDGLDEVRSSQKLCVKAINQLLGGENSTKYSYLVVCSRSEAYEKVVRVRQDGKTDETRLSLNNAVLLKPLTPEQIQSYLLSTSQIEFWYVIQQDAELLKLAQIPLFLSVLRLISPSGKFSLDKWRNLTSTQYRQQYLFDVFWEERIECVLVDEPHLLKQGIKSRTYKKRKLPSSIQTEKWLAWLAKQLEQESKEIFLIEQLQPTLLQETLQKEGYILVYILITVIIAELPIKMCEFFAERGIWFIVTVCLNLVVLYLAGITIWKINTPLRPKFSLKVFLEVLNKLRPGLILFLFTSPLPILLYAGMTRAIIILFSSGLILGIVGVVILYVNLMLTTDTDLEENVIQPNQGIKRLRNNTRDWTVFGLILGVFLPGIFVLREYVSYKLIAGSTPEGMLLAVLWGLWLMPNPITGAGIGLYIGLLLGGLTCIKHFALRCILCWSGNMPWDYAQFLDYCTERLLLEKVGGRYKFIHNLFQKYVAHHKGIDEVSSV